MGLTEPFRYFTRWKDAFSFTPSLEWATLVQPDAPLGSIPPSHLSVPPLSSDSWKFSVWNCSLWGKSTTRSPPSLNVLDGFVVCSICSIELGFKLFQLRWRRNQQDFLLKCSHRQSAYFSVGKRINHWLLHLPITHKGRQLLAGPICGPDQQTLVIKRGKRKTPGWNFTYFKWIKVKEWQWEESDTALDPRFGNPYEEYQS